MPADAYAIAASGMAAQQTQMDLIAANLANVSTTRTAEGGPYHARTAILQAATPFSQALQQAQSSVTGNFSLAAEPELGNPIFGEFASDETVTGEDAALQPAGVEVAGIVAASGQLRKDQPLADVDPIEQMVALVTAGRAYDANVAVLQAAKQMDLEAADISRLA